MRSLGLDIGSNSVGSAWIDTETQEVVLGVSVFPAGVEDSDEKRGMPKNQARRGKRSLRRTIRRRARRKLRLRNLLVECGLLPKDREERRKIFGPRRKGEDFDLEKWQPWRLRRDAVQRQLNPYEFGRVLVHINQRRGSSEIKLGDASTIEQPLDGRDEEEKKQKEEKKKATAAARRTSSLLGGKFFGEWMADEHDRRVRTTDTGHEYRDEIRNRRNKLVEANGEALLANREMIRREFEAIWTHQCDHQGELSEVLRSQVGQRLHDELFDPKSDATGKARKKAWREGGIIFGQRKTFWKITTLGRCDLEPTDRCICRTDMYAEQYRVIETVNNIRVKTDGRDGSLSPLQRQTLIEYLSTPQFQVNKKTGENEKKTRVSIPDVKTHLDVDEINLDRLKDREINTNWFMREAVHGTLTVVLPEKKAADAFLDRVNRELLRLDPESDSDTERLIRVAIDAWKLPLDAANRLVDAWRERPKLARLNLSRRAIRNLLPYMNAYDQGSNRWPTENEARQAFAEDPDAVDQTASRPGKLKPATALQRLRYAHTVTPQVRQLVLEQIGGDLNKYEQLLRLRGLRKRDIQFLKKHPEQILPPAPELSNPVVRKAIHVVRKHVIAHLKAHRDEMTGRFSPPDQIVIELAREIRQSGKVRDAALRRNQNRNNIRKDIAKKWIEYTKGDPQHPAVDRVLLCRQQNFTCAYSGIPMGTLEPEGEGRCVYSGKAISEGRAASGESVEIDHVVPRSRGGDNGLNNKVLCYVEANRRKANKTPKESLSDDEFEALEQAMWHLKSGTPTELDYFTKKDYGRKWANLHREPSPSEFRASQLSDTAYAAKQVGAYLRAALFPKEPHRVVFTKGAYTDVLRRDWRLFQRLPEPWPKDRAPTESELANRAATLRKDRSDHRHHAIDAAVIALTVNQLEPDADYLVQLKQELEEFEEAKERARVLGGSPSPAWPKRRPLLPPWPKVTNPANAAERQNAWQQFRRDLLSKAFGDFDVMYGREKDDGVETGHSLVVSHRPLKRLYGALHEDTPYGEAKEYPGLFTTRKDITELKPGHFIEPQESSGGKWKIPGKGQGQAIRDPDLRNAIRICLNAGNVRVSADDARLSQLKALTSCNCLHPAPDLASTWEELKDWLQLAEPRLVVDLKQDWSTKAQRKAFEIAVKIMARHGGFRMPTGMPIKGMRLLLALSNPVEVEKSGVKRYYKGGNNHHLEIFEQPSTGKWVGRTISMYEEAQRNVRRLRTLKRALTDAGVPPLWKRRKNKEELERWRPAIRKITAQINGECRESDRASCDGKRFVLSLALGEMISLLPKKGGNAPEIYRVVEVKGSPKLDKQPQNKVILVPHWDARRAKAPGVLNPREETPRNASQIKDLIVDPTTVKMTVDPLGRIRWAND